MSHAPMPYRIRGDEIDPPEDDFDEREEAWDAHQEDKFEQQRDEQMERDFTEED